MRCHLLAVLVLLISSSACTTVIESDDSASTSGGAGADEDFSGTEDGSDEGGSDDGGSDEGGSDEGGGAGSGEQTPPEGGEGTDVPPVATNKCVDDEDFVGADGIVHLEPGGCELVDDTSQCCLDTTGTKWVCTGGNEFPGALDIHDYASFPCPGL